jgi:regulator of sigma E protease
VIGKKVGETQYDLNIIPFGGYVKIFGEDGEAVADETVSEADKARSFVRKPRYVQAIVLASGVLGNIVFAWLLISISFMSGIPSAVSGRYADHVQNPQLTITSVLPDSPAERAGLRSGDRILAVSDSSRLFKETDADTAREFISASKGALTLEYGRGKETLRTQIEPVAGIVEGKVAIGVGLETIGTVSFGFFRSLFEGILMTWDLLREVTIGLFGFLSEAIVGQADLGSISGPVGIAGLVGEARVLGFVYLLSFTAFISINLAVINLLPIPALDGGRLLFLAIEGITRRSIPAKFTRIVNTAGFVILIAFMLFITYRDIVKLF